MLCFPHLLQSEPLTHSRPLLTLSSAGDILTLRDRSASVSMVSLSPGMHKVLFEPSEHLWQVWA